MASTTWDTGIKQWMINIFPIIIISHVLALVEVLFFGGGKIYSCLGVIFLFLKVCLEEITSKK